MTTLIELIPAPGRVRVRTSTGLLRPQVRAIGATSAQVTLVATGATLLGGDQVELDVRVGAGLTLDLSDVAGTVVYDGRGQECSWSTSVTVAEDATLVWHGEPVVIADGGQLRRSTDVDVTAGGRLLLRDTLTLGRTGEDGGSLECRTRMSLGGLPLLAEDLALSPPQRHRPGVLGDAKVLDTITAVGWHPSASAPGVLRYFDLPRDGLMARALVPRAHLSPAASLWSSWRDELFAH